MPKLIFHSIIISLCLHFLQTEVCASECSMAKATKACEDKYARCKMKNLITPMCKTERTACLQKLAKSCQKKSGCLWVAKVPGCIATTLCKRRYEAMKNYCDAQPDQPFVECMDSKSEVCTDKGTDYYGRETVNDACKWLKKSDGRRKCKELS
jgi:hypothetical protein